MAVLKKNDLNRQSKLSKPKNDCFLLLPPLPPPPLLAQPSLVVPYNPARWVVDNLRFPRVLCQTSILSMDVRQNHATHGGEVVECLLPQDHHSVSIGVIALEWGEWLPA